MEKTALEALSWALIFGDKVALTHPQAAAAALKPTIRRQILLFCAKTHGKCLKHLGGRALTSVKGAPETIERLLAASQMAMTRHANGPQGAAAVSSVLG